MAPPADDLLDRHELDTWLARALLRSGRLSVELLRQGLRAARAGREAGGTSLARRLLSAQLCEEEELQQLLSQAESGRQERKDRSGAWETGLQVADYRLEERLGAGGMGEVWRATHLPTGAERAVKVLALQGDPEGALRFQREGQSQARVGAHPNVIAVHEVGVQEGRAYLAMDVAPDGSLSRRLAGGRLEARAAAELVAALARGLAHVHAEGVLHRDLKPDNVLFRGETPLLADFGLAKLLDERSLTATGVILGTPSYMAPEQIDPSRGAVDERSDVYGLGAILYHCLTGHPPFTGGSPIAILVQVTGDEPRPPSAFAPVPRQLEAICLRALSKDMQRRPPSAVALGEELEAFLAGEQPPPRRAPLALGLLLALGALGAALAGLGGSEPASSASASPTPTSTPRRARRLPKPTPRASPAGEGSWPSPAELGSVDQRAWEAVGPRRVSHVAGAVVFLDRVAALGFQPARLRLAYVACVTRPLRDPVWGHSVLLEAAAEGDSTALNLLLKIHARHSAGVVGIEQDLGLARAVGFLYQELHPEGEEREVVRGELAKIDARVPPPSDRRQAQDTVELARAAARKRLERAREREWGELDEATKEVEQAFVQEEALRRAGRRGVPRAWRKLGQAYVLHGPKQDAALGAQLLALATLGEDEEAAFYLACALVTAHECRDNAARALFTQDIFLSFRAGFNRPALAALLFEFASRAAASDDKHWASLARQCVGMLEREGYATPGDPRRALLQARDDLLELERILWTRLDHEGYTLTEVDRQLLKIARGKRKSRQALLAIQLRLSQRGHRRSLVAGVVPAIGRQDVVYAHALLLQLALEGHEDALVQLVQVHMLDNVLGFGGIERDPALGAAALELLEPVVRSSPQVADRRREGLLKSARKQLRVRSRARRARPREVVQRAWHAASEELRRSGEALWALAAAQRGQELARTLERLAGRGDGAAHLDLARGYARGARGLPRNEVLAREHLYYAVMATSLPAVWELGRASLHGVEGLPAEAERLLASAGPPSVDLEPDRALGLACLRAVYHTRIKDVRVKGRALLRALSPHDFESISTGQGEDWELVHQRILARLHETK